MPTGSEIPREFPNGLRQIHIQAFESRRSDATLFSRRIPNSVRGQEGTYGEGGKTVRDPGGRGKMVGETAIYSCVRSRKAGIAKSPKRVC